MAPGCGCGRMPTLVVWVAKLLKWLEGMFMYCFSVYVNVLCDVRTVFRGTNSLFYSFTKMFFTNLNANCFKLNFTKGF